MKKINFFNNVLLLIYLMSISGHYINTLHAQTCASGSTTFYGLNTTGRISTINVSTGAVGVSIHSQTTGSVAENSNGIGYNIVNGKFYYFYRSAALVAPINEFVSYDPATGILANLSLTGYTSTRKVRSGCINNTGTGYYCIDPGGGAIPASLYYYSIVAGTWTKTTSVFMDGATDVSATFKSRNSGDMAFDGNGNLWMLVANGTNYGMYKIAAANVPTTVVGSVAVQEIIDPSTLSASLSGVSVTGFAWNSAGEAFLTTGTGNNRVFRMTASAVTPSPVATIATDDMGADLTSCSAPLYILPSTWSKFTAEVRNGIQLKWSISEEATVVGYSIQYSTDRENWKTLDFIERKNVNTTKPAEYIYNHQQYISGNNYYRIQQLHQSGRTNNSSIKLVTTSGNSKIFIGPNPAKDVLYIHSKGSLSNQQAIIFDDFGRLISSTIVRSSNQSIDISKYRNGSYIVKLTSLSDDQITIYKFVKW